MIYNQFDGLPASAIRFFYSVLRPWPTLSSVWSPDGLTKRPMTSADRNWI